jgi:uncharacterized protein (DUF885 family)
LRRILFPLCLILLAALLAAAALFVNVWYFKPITIDAFYTREFVKFALDRPQFLSEIRLLPAPFDFYSTRLDDLSPEAERKEAAAARTALEVLQRYDRTALTGEDRLSYDVFQFFMRSTADGAPFVEHGFPMTQLFGPHVDFPRFMAAMHRVTTAREARSYVARLVAFSKHTDELLAALESRRQRRLLPPRFVVEKVLDQLTAFTAPAPSANALYRSFADRLAAIPESAPDAAERGRLLAAAESAIRDDVYPAYGRLAGHFRALLDVATANDGAWSMPDGDAYYAWCVRRATTTSLSPNDIHDLGLKTVARVGAELDRALASHGYKEGSLGERLQRLTRDPAQSFPNDAAGRDAMLARYRSILDDADRGLGNTFDRRPKGKIEVRRVAEFAQQGAPIAFYEAGSADGVRPGIFYANLRDTTAMPKFEMATFAYHEGIPGHHFQNMIAIELTGLPLFRRLIPFTAYVEGWGLYAERLAAETGLPKDPLDEIGRLRWEMLRAVRLVVDTGIHAKRWTREQAIAYMMQHTGKDEAFATAEIERYFVNPGQAVAYYVGMLKILELRERAKSALGPAFSLAAFHDQVLTHGALPLVVLEGVIDGWIQRSRARAN